MVVQRAAQHLLAISALGRTDLGTMDIFPSEVGAAEHGTSDYTWRQQLAWSWAKAGYLRQRLVGKGLAKHWAYTLSRDGRAAIERIATDPAIAAFYVKAKRSSTSENYPAEWYQPPQLVGLEESSSEDEGTTASEEEEGDGASEAANGDEEQELNAAPEDALGGLAVYFERTTAVLEAIATRVAGLEREVKAQSEFVLEAAQKMDHISEVVSAFAAKEPATRDDLGRALAEIASSFVKTRELDAAALRQVVREASVLDAAALRQVVRETSAETRATLKVVVTEAQAALQSAMEVAAASSKPASLDTEVIGHAVTSAVGEVIRESITDQFKEVSELVEEVSDGLSLVKDDIGQLSGVAAALNEKFDENAASFRKQVSAISDAAVHTSESARETLDAARAVSREMLGVAMERASRDEPIESVRARSEQAIDRLEAVGLRGGRTSASALGAGLIRNPGSGK